MDKKAIIIIGVILLVGLGVGIWIWNTVEVTREEGEKLAEPITEVSLPEGIIYFYGQECPHCQKVGEFLDQNKIAEKVVFTKLEVWHNDDNNNMMLQAAKNCQLFMKDVGVPFLYDGQNCIIGEVDVMNFFRQKAGI